MSKLILRLLVGILLGIIPSIWIIQNNYYAKLFTLHSLIQILEKEWKSNITVENSTFNLLTGTINLQKIKIQPNKSSSCLWTCKSGTIQILKRSSFLDNRINLHVSLYDNEIQTNYQNKQLEVSTLLSNIFATSSKIVSARSFEINNATIKITNSPQKPLIYLNGILLIKKDNTNFWHGRLSISDGTLTIQNNNIIEKIKGITLFHEPQNDIQPWNISIQHSCNCTLLKNNKYCQLTGKWTQNEKFLMLKNNNETLNMLLTPTNNIFNITANLKFDDLLKSQKLKTLHGTCKINAQINPSSKILSSGKIIINNFYYNNFNIKKIQSDFSQTLTNITSNIFVQDLKNTNLTGKMQWNINKSIGTLSLHNTTTLKILNQYQIHPKALQINASINSKLKLETGNYNICVTQQQTQKKYLFTGSFFRQQNNICFSGKSNYGTYFTSINLKEKMPIKKILLIKNGKKIIDLSHDSKKLPTLSGRIRYSFIQSLLPINLRKWLFGNKGIITLDLTLKNKKQIEGDIRLSKGKIRIPENYNLITDLSANFKVNIKNKSAKIKNINLSFYKGKILCKKAIINWNNLKSITFLHSPLKLQNILVNWKKDFFGIISGYLFLKRKAPNPLTINGNIIIKKSLLKENIFSKSLSSELISNSILPFMQDEHQATTFDINIYNEEYLNIKTPVLRTQATTDLNIKVSAMQNSLINPQIIGSIILHQGSFTFPRNKLFITSGKIQFIPNQINNPIIDLSAKNRIKKYTILLQITGTLQKPTILLESNPELTEEQILALLFAGSENTSLQADLPAILMQNLHTLFLESKEHLPQTTSFFKKLTQPLKYIQITPNFTDQSGRGGVKGIISIDINKQLHANIQKNFTLQDDLAFQIEYFLSDDFNIKAIKDYRGDIGAEIEFRLKPQF